MAAMDAAANMPPEQQKYMEEAAKRRRADGMSQFQELHHSSEERLRHLVDDLFADHEALDKMQPPIKSGDHVKFLIIGAGMGGILSAVRLIQAGFTADQIKLVEVAGGVGGTWYWNRYPGLHCDVESYIYLPLLEEMDYVPSHKYASGAEIRSYLGSVVKKFGLESQILYRAQLNGLQWDNDSSAWRADVTSNHGPRGQEQDHLWVTAEFVYLTIGLFPRPQVPKLPGLSAFEGEMFHTGRWDYRVSGGSGDAPFTVLEKLKGKRVGIIGTGASAIQVVPEVAKYAQKLYVFQRTPSQVNVRAQRKTDPVEWREKIAAKPGWQKHRSENVAEHIALGAPDDHEDLVNDAWTKIKSYYAIVGSDQFGTITPDKIPEHIGNLMARDAEHSANARARVAAVVKDKETAEKLTPWYPTWCKRPTFSDVYLQTFNEPHVKLVDTDGKGVQSIAPRAVVANGTDYPIDVLILSTGYRSPGYGGGDVGARVDVNIVGRDSRSLADKCAAEGTSTLHGCATNGFPNLFIGGPSQGGATPNFAHPIEVLSRHTAHIVKLAHERVGGLQTNGVIVEVTREAEEEWSMRIAQGATLFAAVASCTPGYITNEGEVFKAGRDQTEMFKLARGGIWPDGMLAYARELEKWEDQKDLRGIQVSVK